MPPEVAPNAGQRWGVAVVAALPAVLVALAMPLVIEGSLSGFVYAPLVLIVIGVTAGLGPWFGLGAVAFGMGVGIAVGPGGYASSSLLLSAGLAGALMLGTWLGQVLARGRYAVAAAIPSIGLVVGVLATGVSGSLEAGVLAAFTALSVALLLILIGPWNGTDAVRPARWAEVLAVISIAVCALATYVVSINSAALVGTPLTVQVFGRETQQSRTEGGVPDPFLVAARWQLDPSEAARVLFTLGTGPDAPQNRPTWATFSTYNGIAWIEPPTYGVPGDSIPPEAIGAPAETFEAATRITVAVGMPGQWVPVPQRVDQVLSPVATRADPISGIVAAVSSPVDQTFDIRYSLAVADDKAVRDAKPALSPDLDPAVAIPGPLVGPMATLSREIVDEAGESTWDRLVMLSQSLRADTYVAAPAQALAAGPPDRSYAGLDRVLAEGVGFQEQYAAIWAITARSWGVPTRLVIGFVPEDAAGATADAAGVTTVTAGQASVWAEARLDGLGWVAFQPSPQDRDASRPAVVRPLTPSQVPDQPQPSPTSSPSGGQDGGATDGSTDANPVSEATRAIPWTIVVPALVVLLGVMWIAYVALRRRRIRAALHSDDARDSVAGAWAWMRLMLEEAWIALPMSYAPAIDADAPDDLPDELAEPVVTMARIVGPALYGSAAVNDAAVDLAWRSADSVAAAVRRSTGWRTTLRRLMVPLEPLPPGARGRSDTRGIDAPAPRRRT